ncbi:MAG: hypothetical protein HYT21_02935 [Candidatus Nealsonbacteria bacterium]|nr:hypothetical protein [Candidatus Nealsonbacteria bacterium]
MKKALVAVVAGLLLLGAAGSAIADEEANFKKAGQQVLAEKERLLAEKRDAVLATAGQVAADQIVDGKEMRELQKGIEDFGQAKSNADDYLKFYELATTVVLPDELVLAVNGYWDATGWFARDRKAKVRTYLVRLTGRDVTVRDYGPVNGVLQIFLFVMAIVATLFSFTRLATRQFQSYAAPVIMSFILALLFWSALFFL